MRKWWVTFATLTLLALIILHSPLIERPILNRVTRVLADLGIDLRADSLDINVFRLRAELTGVEARGRGWQTQLQLVSLNLGAGVLRGRIDIDAVVLSKGQVSIDDNLFAGGETSNSDPVWPEIHLGVLTVDDVALQANGRTLATSISARDLTLRRADDRLNLAFSADQIAVAGQNYRDVVFDVSLRTTDFVSYDDIQLTLNTAHSSMMMAGTADLRKAQYALRLESALGADVTQYSESVRLNAVIENQAVHWNAGTKVLLMSDWIPLEVNGELAVSQHPQTSLLARVGDVAQISGMAAWNGHQVEASFDARLELLRLDPQLVEWGLEVLDVHGSFQGTDDWQANLLAVSTSPARLESRFTLGSDGSLAGDLSYAYRGAQIVGWLDDRSRGTLQVHMGAEFLSKYLAAGQISLDRLEFSMDIDDRQRTLAISRGRGEAHGLVVAGQALGSARLLVGGDRHVLDVGLTLTDGTGEAFAVIETANWNLSDACMSLTNFGFPLEPAPLRVSGDIRASGSVFEPRLTGLASASFALGGQQGLAVASLDYGESVLTSPYFDLNLGSLSVTGKGFFRSLEQWSADGLIVSQPQELMLDSGAVGLPQASIGFSADANGFHADIRADEQAVRIGDRLIAWRGRDSVPIEMDYRGAPHLRIEEPIEIAGITLFGAEFGTDQNGFFAKADWMLSDWDAALQAMGDATEDRLMVEKAAGQLHLSVGADGGVATCITASDISLTWDQIPAEIDSVAFSLDDGLDLELLEARVLGLAVSCQRLPGPREWPKTELQFGTGQLDCACDFNLVDPTAWRESAALLGLDVTLNELQGSAYLVSDFSFDKPRFALWVDELAGQYQETAIKGENVAIAYDGNWHSNEGVLLFDRLPITLVAEGRDLHVRSVLGVSQLQEFVPELLGDALFWIDARIPSLDRPEGLNAEFRQLTGSLFNPDPFLEVQGVLIQVQRDDRSIKVFDSKVVVNGSQVALWGAANLSDAGLDWDVSVYGEEVPLSVGDFFGRTGLALRLHKPPGQRATLRGEVSLGDGFYAPDESVESLVLDMLEETEAIVFPNPVLAEVDMQLLVRTTTPLIVEHDLGFLVLDGPDLLVLGTMAQPELASGTLIIQEGSELAIGRETYVFRESQVQFHANRPGEPYLQVFLEYGDFSGRQPIQLLGYMSELEGGASSGELTNILANYLLGHVSSAVSLESEQNEQVFNRAFSIVFTQPLHEKLVSRIAVPIDDPSRQRIELGIGPYYESYMSAVYEENEITYDIRRRHQLGNPRNRPERIKSIRWTGIESRSLRRKTGLRKGDLYNETDIRRARLRLDRHWVKKGYLEASVQTTFVDGDLMVEAERGPQTTMTVNALQLSDEAKAQVFRIIRQSGDAATQRLEKWARDQAIREGARDAVAKVQRGGHQWSIDVQPGAPIGRVTIDFGEATGLLKGLVDRTGKGRSFLTEYLIAPARSEAVIRARLAAQGYVEPRIGRGSFRDQRNFFIPVELGRLAHIHDVVTVNRSEPLPNGMAQAWRGKPFNFGSLKAFSSQLNQERRRDQRALIEPRLLDGNVVIEVQLLTAAEPVFHEIAIQGDQRVSGDRVSRFFTASNGLYSQSALIRAQEELIRTGTYRAVRIMSEDDQVRVALEERNRWDFEYGLAINEYQEPTLVAQFRDNMFGSRVNTFSVRGEAGPTQRSFAADWLLRRVFHSPFNLYLNTNWERSTRDDDPDDFTPPLQIESQRRFVFPEDYLVSAQLSYPVSARAETTLGTEYRRVLQHEEVIYYIPLDEPMPGDPIDPNDITEIQKSTSHIDLTPIKFSWSYRDLDHKNNPRSGFLMRIGLEHYVKALGSDVAVNGTRANIAFTSFMSRGPWLWQQRYKSGFYRPKNAIPDSFSDQRDPLLFYLGGPTTIRGYRQDLLGPFNRQGDRVVGGEAMIFASHELSYDIGWQGLSVSLYADGGRVWGDSSNIEFKDFTVTSGLGMGWDGPIGHIQLDWAYRVEEHLPDNLVIDVVRDWHLRYGRTF